MRESKKLRGWMNTYLLESEADIFRDFLNENDIYYEASECGDGIHFEVYVDTYERVIIDEFIAENF